jgi:hypothetical protein
MAAGELAAAPSAAKRNTGVSRRETLNPGDLIWNLQPSS